MTLSEQDLRQLLHERESDTLEFKRDVPDPLALASLIGSMAMGGRIVIGVQEPGHLVGVDERRLYQAWQEALKTIHPRPGTSLDLTKLDGKAIGIITVAKSSDPTLTGQGPPTPNQRIQLTLKQRFILSAFPTEWAAYADELKHAADLLHKQAREGLIGWVDHAGHLQSKSHVSRSYILLAAFALENVLKGLIVLANPQYVSSGQLNKRLQSHKLIQLSHQVEGLVLSPDEQRLCAIAQEAIPYWGRYPVPLKAEELKEEQFLTTGFHETFLGLYYRLRHSLESGITKGWDGGENMRLPPR